jgi:hypothetical protein
VGKSVLQDWVQELGLRHQGVLLTAVRGCDTAPKDDPSKRFTRCYRSVVLNDHCGDPRKSASFIEWCAPAAEGERFHDFRAGLDHYPQHYVAHVMHAVEIVGYKHPDRETRARWHGYYLRLCKGLHVNPESEWQLDARLNAAEKDFGASQ